MMRWPRPAYCALHRGAGGAADRRPGSAGDHERLPGGRRRLLLGGDDRHLVAVEQLRDERRRPAVDAAADGRVAHVGVDGIGEVDGVGAARQRYELALGGEAEHLVLEQLELGVFEELLGVVALGEHRHRAPEPGEGPALASSRTLSPALLSL